MAPAHARAYDGESRVVQARALVDNLARRTDVLSVASTGPRSARSSEFMLLWFGAASRGLSSCRNAGRRRRLRVIAEQHSCLNETRMSVRPSGAGKGSRPPAMSDLEEPGARKTQSVEWCLECAKIRQAPAEARRAGTRETAVLVRCMASANRLWGAERIRGELLKLGIKVSKRTIQRYMRAARLERDALPPLSVARLVHGIHGAACDTAKDLVASRSRPVERQRCSLISRAELRPLRHSHSIHERDGAPLRERRRDVALQIARLARCRGPAQALWPQAISMGRMAWLI